MVRPLWLAVMASICLSAPALAQQPVLLDFSIAGCGPCQQLEPTIRRLEAEGFAVRRVDGHREPALAARYGVTSYPTLIVVAGGQATARWVGVQHYSVIRDALLSASQATLSATSNTTPQGTFRQGSAFQVGSDLGAVPEVAIPGVADTSSQTQRAAPLGKTDRRLLNSTVRFRVRERGGSSYGTGTVIDARSGDALVLTCAHLFRELAEDSPTQPAIMIELFEADAAGGVRVVERVAGQLLTSNSENDVALVAIRQPRTPVAAAPIASSPAAVSVGIATKSVGCSLGADPTIENSRVQTVDRYLSPPSLTTGGAPKLGRSGGGLFNERGELIGVCFGAVAEDGEGFYAKLSSIYAELDKLGLQELYRPGGQPATALASAAIPPATPAAAGGLARAEAPATKPGLQRATDWPQPAVVRGQGGTPARRPSVDRLVAGLSTAERAAVGEIARRVAESEVVCVVRPKSPGGQSEVITLDSASPELVRLLLAIGSKGERR
ncbi:MAG: trypsin-like peptidase domain-containing protein [Planctomycetota bacterium]